MWGAGGWGLGGKPAGGGDGWWWWREILWGEGGKVEACTRGVVLARVKG